MSPFDYRPTVRGGQSMRRTWARVLAILRRPKPISAWVAAVAYLMVAPKLAPPGFDDRYLNLWFLSAVAVFCLWTAAVWRLRDWQWRRQTPSGYRVYTRNFDREIAAAEIDAILPPISSSFQAEFDAAWEAFSNALVGWRTKAHLTALEASGRIRQAINAEALAETTVTVLVDQSGSMRGQSMLLAAAATDVACDFLVHLGVTVEVLGFTTASWNGGESRARWLREGRPDHPGRLCDLLHIVYRSSEDPRASTGGGTFRPMLRPDLPKENVDGEAVAWAASRLLGRERPRKILLVISDGVPADDSTLMANAPSILEDHLRWVLADIERAGRIRAAAVGIGFDVSRYYSVSTTVTAPDGLGAAVIGLLERTLLETGDEATQRIG